MMAMIRRFTKKILDELLDYTAYHFGTEEMLFQKYDYPEYSRHKKEHDTLTWKVLDIRSRYASGEGVETSEIFEFLKSWLENHLLNSDKKYSGFLNSKGVQ